MKLLLAALSAASLAVVISACGGANDETREGDGSYLSRSQPVVVNPKLLSLSNQGSLRSSPTATTTTLDATTLMNWAEATYPGLFPSSQSNNFSGPYIYRYYPETRNYLGIAGEGVYLLGPASGGILAWVGRVADFTCLVLSSACVSSESSESDGIVAGGDNISDSTDSDLSFVPFSLSTIASAIVQDQRKIGAVPMSNAAGVAKLEKEITWLSQDVAGCVPKETKNGFCGDAAILMAALYLDARGLAPPGSPGTLPGTDSWILSKVIDPKRKEVNPNLATACGGAGIVRSPTATYGISKFAESLNLEVNEFPKVSGRTDEQKMLAAEQWIRDALAQDAPVVARVHYQGKECVGRGSTSREAFYDSGRIERTMKRCYEKDEEIGHIVLVTEIGTDYVIVYDSDPFAVSVRGGKRKYTKSSFLEVLLSDNPKVKIIDKTVPKYTNAPLWKFSRRSDSSKPSFDLTIPKRPVELVSGEQYSEGNSSPLVGSTAPNTVVSGTNLPEGIELDVSGRPIGRTSAIGTFSVSITARSTENGVERIAHAVAQLAVRERSAVQSQLQFANSTELRPATAGSIYLNALGVGGATDAVLFRIISGSLPAGISLVNGQLAGQPTTTGTFDFVLMASTPGSSITKQFVLRVNAPSPSQVPAVAAPVLDSVSPSVLIAKNQQQDLTLSGSGFSNDMRVELVDRTNGGTFYKVPVSVNSSGTSAVIRANFTSAQAQWTARVISRTALFSAPVSFSVSSECLATQTLVNGQCVLKTTGSPDLRVVGGGLGASSVSPGGSLQAFWSIVNQGAGGASASNTAVRINQSSSSAGGSNAAVIATGALAANGSQSQSANLTVPSTPGTYYVWVIADNNSTSGQSAAAASNDFVLIGSITVSAPTAPSLPGTFSLNTPFVYCDTSFPAGPAAQFSWSSSANASTYQLFRNSQAQGSATSGTSFVNNVGLVGGGNYSYFVRASNANGTRDSNSVSVSIPANVCTPNVSGLSPNSVNRNSGTQSLTIFGSNFYSGNWIAFRWLAGGGGSSSRAPTSVSGSQLQTTFNPGSVVDTIYVRVCESSSLARCSSEFPISVR